MKKPELYSVLGIMSGTSLDGLDMAYCRFYPPTEKKPFLKWKYKIIAAKTVAYNKKWKQKLFSVEKKTAEELAQTHAEYGHFIGETAKKFLKEKKTTVDFIASHGHTIFHQPEKKFTFQLGSGAAIAAETGFPVICDFRTTDVALGGQGAPLVPIGDKLLFPAFDFCLNLGGFANISQNVNLKSSLAYDICPANIILNYLAKKTGKEYDENGIIAKEGKTNAILLKELNALKYYSRKPPKSLGKEWLLREFLPILDKYKISIADKMRTAVEHIAFQIELQFSDSKKKLQQKKQKLLITGGGVHNKFLIERIVSRLNVSIEITIPDKLTIDFKEALIFAFLGVLRLRGENNCIASVTGAKRNSCGGAVYLP